MTLQQLVDNFSLKFTKGNTTVTFGKLHFLQRKHAALRAAAGGQPLADIVANITTLLTSPDSPYKRADWEPLTGPSPTAYISSIVQVDAENFTNSNEFLYRNVFFFTPLRPSTTASLASSSPEDVVERSRMLAELGDKEWTREKLMEKVREIIDGRPEGKAGAKEVYHYLRLALTGQEKGMRLYDVMLILGRGETLRRLGVEE
jgi:glutamyl-tRNA synthetase